jgi:glycosyltransferase involved in cell wall biosynthesis
LHARARSLGIAEAILWVDHAGDDDLAGLYNLASVYVSAASREGFGLPVLEAMACGAAVAVSDVAAHREVVGAAGFLLPEDDLDAWESAVGGLLLDRGAAKTIGAKAEERASQFTWRRTAERTLEAYGHLT